MKRFSIVLFVLLTGLVGYRAMAAEAEVRGPELDRSIGAEPEYRSPEPLYGLLVFGPGAEHRVWLVHDRGPQPKPDKQGRRSPNLDPSDDILYVDRNGNGDLTERDERVTAATKDVTTHYWRLGESTTTWPFFNAGDLSLPDSRSEITDLTVEHNFRWFGRCFYTIHLRVNAKGQRYSDTPLLFSTSPDTAPVIWFDGPLTVQTAISDGVFFPSRYDGKEPDPPYKTQKRLIPGTKTLFGAKIGTKGDGPGAFTTMALDEISENVHVVAEFTFPHRVPGRDPLAVVLPLSRRVCGNRFGGDLLVPAEASPGKAAVRLTVVGWQGTSVAPTTSTLEITPSQKGARPAQQAAPTDAEKPRR
jgi:hypothetical protein